MRKKGILLVQLGTPDELSLASVRRYLRLFLSDKRVVDINAPLRYLLLYCFILPFRAPKTLKAYEAIWTKQGSPLRVTSEALRQKLQKALQATHIVTLGMRYGEPSLKKALDKLQPCDEITVLPLYPQYADSTTASSFEAVDDYLTHQKHAPKLRLIRDFYNHPAFIEAETTQIKPFLEAGFDHMLFSYHGLPIRHLKKSADYPKQCFETSRLIAKTLKIDDKQYSTAFQSRLGRTEWIKPYTEEVLIELRNQNIKHLLIACPGFVTDCLETLEEIGMRANETWKALGGERLTLVPCLNAEDEWVDALKSICLQQ